MNQRKTNTLLFITVIALAIMILLLIISQAGRGNASTANSGGKGTSQGLVDHLKGTSSSTEGAETPGTNTPPVTPPINNQPPGGSVTESNALAVVPPATNLNFQALFTKPSQPQAKPSQSQSWEEFWSIQTCGICSKRADACSWLKNQKEDIRLKWTRTQTVRARK